VAGSLICLTWINDEPPSARTEIFLSTSFSESKTDNGTEKASITWVWRSQHIFVLLICLPSVPSQSPIAASMSAVSLIADRVRL
jgi:hypothetical protein